MSKLTKAEMRLHAQACEILQSDTLTIHERQLVLKNWRPDAESEVAHAGAFFTPFGLAEDFAIEANGAQSVIDLCAGIGGLAYQRWLRGRPARLVCVERNPTFVAVGRKVLPDAEWIQASIFDVPALDLGRFDLAISNPPFGRIPCEGQSPRYRGNLFEYRVIDLASTLAEQGVFLIPRSSAPICFDGRDVDEPRAYRAFKEQTGISIDLGFGIDGEAYRDAWKGTKVVVESVRVDYL